MYHQKHHRFNTFYNHKFGFHITGPRADAFEAVFRLRPKVVKTLDFSVDVMKRIKREIPDVFLIGRLFVRPQDFGQLSGNTAQAARQRGLEMAERILREEVNQDRHHINGQPVFNAWESLNEVFPEWTDETMQKLYDEYQVAFGERMLAAGFEPIAFNFGQGNGRGEQWLRLYPGTLETYNYLGFHEYDWPTMDRLHRIGLDGPDEPHNRVPEVGDGRGNDGMWRCLRYRRIMYEGIRQKYGDKHTAIITECGMTQGVWTPAKDIGPWATELTVPRDIPGGIVSTPISVNDYWQTLQWYNSELMKDDFVMGACLFVTGAAGQVEWETFEHLGPIMDRIAAFQRNVPLDEEAGSAGAGSRPGQAGTANRPEPRPPEREQPASGGSSASTARERLRATLRGDRGRTSSAGETPIRPAPLPAALPDYQPIPALATGNWRYKLIQGDGPARLSGDIGVPEERIIITHPDGRRTELTSGSRPEHGAGGFELANARPGMYEFRFLNAIIHLRLSGQLTHVLFEQYPDPENLTAQVSLQTDQSVYKVGEPIGVKMRLENSTTQPVPFTYLGLAVNTGHFQLLEERGSLNPGARLEKRETFHFSAPGRYTIQLVICFSEARDCLGSDENWQGYGPEIRLIVT